MSKYPRETSTSLHEIICGKHNIYGLENNDFSCFNEEDGYSFRDYLVDFSYISSYIMGSNLTIKYINENKDHLKSCFKRRISEGDVLYDFVSESKDAKKYFDENFFTEKKEDEFFSSEFLKSIEIIKEKKLDLEIANSEIASSISIILKELEDKLLVNQLIIEK